MPAVALSTVPNIIPFARRAGSAPPEAIPISSTNREAATVIKFSPNRMTMEEHVELASWAKAAHQVGRVIDESVDPATGEAQRIRRHDDGSEYFLIGCPCPGDAYFLHRRVSKVGGKWVVEGLNQTARRLKTSPRGEFETLREALEGACYGTIKMGFRQASAQSPSVAGGMEEVALENDDE